MKRKIIYAFAAVVLTAIVTKTQAQTDWHITGNAGTNATTNFIGTTDKIAFKIRTNNSTRMTINSTGLVGIGTATPGARLDVFGGTGTTVDTLHAMHVIVKKTGNYDVIAVDAESQPAVGYGIGVKGHGNSIGVWGDGDWGVLGTGGSVGGWFQSAGFTDTTTATGNEADGIDAIAGPSNFGVGVYAQSNSSRFNYALYTVVGPNGTPADSDNTHSRWAGYFLGDIVSSRSYKFSDAKLKNNIQPITSALEKIGKLQTATYTFKQSEFPDLSLPGGNQIGFIAENMETVFPELVKDATSAKIAGIKGKTARESVAFKAVNYEGIIPVTVAAINEQQKLIQNQSAVIAEQNNKITKLENQIAEIQNALATQKVSVNEQSAYLMQNTPNPSNGTTTVKFFLPENSKGVLELTDATGKVVKSYKVSGSGLSQVEINTASFAVGSYTYSLLIDGKVSDSKSMVITK